MPTPREAYTNTVEQRPYSRERLNPADFGASGQIMGKAVAGFGQDVGKVTDFLVENERQDAETAAQEADNLRVAARLKRYYEGPDAFFSKQGVSAVEDVKKLREDLDRFDNEAWERVKGKPLAEKLFREMTLKRNNDEMPKVASFVNAQRQEHEKKVRADAFDLAIDNATLTDDPDEREEHIATAGNLSVAEVLRTGNYDPNAIKQARQAGVGKAVEAVAQRLNSQSPLAAQAFVKTKAAEMDPQEVVALLTTLAPAADKELAGEAIGNFIVLKGGGTPEGATPVAPGAGGPTEMPDEAVLAAAQWDQESGGRHKNPDGTFVTSKAGARGVSQVMPATGVDPGYGVKPLQNNSREEFIRFGNDYRRAMLKEYGGNIVLALTAYNWGPKNVNDHIRRVGNPAKGEISDAEFLASIPVKEAREYAPSVLARTGVQISGAATAAAANAPQVAQGVEVDLDATFNRIQNTPGLTFGQREALKAEASRRHSIGQQAKAADEEALRERVASILNTLPPDGFTSYEKHIPIDVRRTLETRFPELALSYKNMADANEKQRLAQIEARNREARAAENERQLLEAFVLQDNPDAFLKADFIGDPQWKHLTTSQRMQLTSQQRAERQQRQGGGKPGEVSYENARGAVNLYLKRNFGIPKDEAGKKAYEENLGRAYEAAYQMAQAEIKRNGGKPLTPAEYDAIGRRVTQPVTIEYKGGNEVVPRSEVTRRRAELGDSYISARGDTREAFRSEMQLRFNRPISEPELDAAMDAARRAGVIR